MDTTVAAVSHKPIIQMKKDMKYALAVLLGIWVLYALLSLLAPPVETVTKYALTPAQTQWLRLSYILPLLFIWVTALFSFVWFRRYTALIKGSKEESAYKKITIGIALLLAVIIFPSFITLIGVYHPGKYEVLRGVTIFRNYFTLALYLAAFYYLWQASKDLLNTIELGDVNGKFQNWVIAGLAVISVIYTWAVITNPFRTISVDKAVQPTYFLPDIFIIFTIVIPYLFVWIMGAWTILNIWSYAKRVNGVIYRQTFYSVAQGLTFTIALVIFLQFLSQANASLGHAALKVILVIIYFLLLAIATGYLFIARGARKLSRIEGIE